jgi:hypothetical protein
MPSRSNRKKKTGSRTKRNNINPSEGVVVYRGPLRLPQGIQERQKITTVTHYGPISLASNGSGTVATVFSDDPTSSVDWSSLAQVWDEYRVLGFTFHSQPFNRYTRTNTEQIGPLFTVIDRDDAVALTTEAQALEYESLVVFYMGDPFKREVRSMTSIEDASFITTATPVARNWLKLIAQNITPSIGVTRVWLDLLIQFRGRN